MVAGRILGPLLAVAAGAAAGVAAWLIPSYGLSPAERERRRRLAVNVRGRVGSAIITELRDGLVSYRYFIAGVEYNAAQDVSTLPGRLPADTTALLERPTAIKYLPENPANSIVLSEHWSGLEFPRSATPEQLDAGTGK